MMADRLHAVGDFRCDRVPVPVPVGRELLVRVGACGICGSDIPRIFTLGASGPLPLTIGHEFSGTIEAVGDNADPALVGRRGCFFPLIPCRSCAACLTGHYAECDNYSYLGSRRDGGFAEYCLVPSEWHFVESRNPHTSLETLAMAEPACVAQHAVRRGSVHGGDTVLIFGAGPIGILAARWASLFGAKTVLVADIVDEKVRFARDRGADAFNCLTVNPAEFVRSRSGGKLADVVIEGTGTGAALGGCADCARPFGTVVLMGNPGGDVSVSREQYSEILRKELTLRSIWNSYFADLPVNEWKHTVDMFDSGTLGADDLITHRTDLPGLPALCRDIYERRVNICKALYVSPAAQ